MKRRVQSHILPAMVGLALALSLMLLLASASQAQEPGTISIFGQVTNGRPGGRIPAGQLVTLHLYQGEMWTTLYTTTLAGDGTFRFDWPEIGQRSDDLAPEPDQDFVARIIYQEVPYYSQTGRLDNGGEVAANITIYEATEAMDAIVVDQAHIFIVPVGDHVQIAEYYLISNTGEHTYVGNADPETGMRTTLAFTLPTSARNLSFDGPGLGERYVGDAQHFSDSQAILPGMVTVEVSYSYELPYHIGMAVSRTLAVPINSVALIVSSEALAVSGAGLMAAGVMETQMGTATSYTAGPLADGETLAFTFTDRPPSTRDNPAMPGQSRASKQRNPAREIGLGLMILALAGLVGYQFWRTPASAPAPEHIRLLIEAVAKLDAEYEAGTLPEAEYQHKRQALRQRIREQMQAPDVYD